MTNVVVAAIGFLIGLIAHDLGVQALRDDVPLKPFDGTCPACSQQRGWLRPRCPNCRRVIQREPVLAVTCALAAVGFLNTTGIVWTAIAYLGFLMLTAALIVTDIEEFRIVDRLNLRGSAILVLALGAAALATGQGPDFGRALLGALAYFAGTTLVWLLVRGRGFGAGDVKLAPQLGLFTTFLSWGTLGWAVFATALIGGVLAIAMIAMGAAKMKTELPYGPPMILGAWLAIILVGVGSIPT